MSPEQAAGEDELTNHRTDIYASGVMLFQMLTGELPFRGNTQAVMFQKSRQDAPSPRLLRPSIPKDLETLCLKCLERDPEKRYDSALILKEELKRVQRGEPIIARPVGPIERAYRTCKRYRLISGLSLGVGGKFIDWSHCDISFMEKCRTKCEARQRNGLPIPNVAGIPELCARRSGGGSCDNQQDRFQRSTEPHAGIFLALLRPITRYLFAVGQSWRSNCGSVDFQR